MISCLIRPGQQRAHGFTITLSWALVVWLTGVLSAEEWRIPLAGNAFRTAPGVGERTLSRDGSLLWSNFEEIYSIFFHIDRPATLDLQLVAKPSQGDCRFAVRMPKQQEFQVELLENQDSTSHLGPIQVEGPMYVRLDIQGVSRSGSRFASLKELVVASDTAKLVVDYVRDNEGNMFYWGRRGPSVHLTYKVPADVKLQYAYSELTVPEGQDPIGSYFMANGFAQGYFGMQVNGIEERRILFSVWSPFQTDNPREIPDDHRVKLISKGALTRVGEFGNEGSGGQSFMIYPWKSGETYRFLTEVRPVDDDDTVFTCWFATKTGDWQLVASFERPKTYSHLRGFHSFLESFDPSRGHLPRRCNYGNIWVCDTAGQWYACEQARFSVDPTGGGRHRLDFEGGVDADRFWLRNCGFFSGNVPAGSDFSRQFVANQAPKIDFASLPR